MKSNKQKKLDIQLDTIVFLGIVLSLIFVLSYSGGNITGAIILSLPIENQTLENSTIEHLPNIIDNQISELNEVQEPLLEELKEEPEKIISTSNLKILAAPVVGNVTLNSTLLTNLTTENLTVYWDSTDNTTKNITNWKLNGSSIAVLNMPFEKVSDSVCNATKDYSGNDNNGSEVGGVLWNDTGGYDGNDAFEFDGVDDEIIVNESSGIDMSGKSLSFWTKPNTIANAHWFFFSTTQDNVRFAIEHQTGTVKGNFFDGAASHGISGDTTLTAGEWTHIVVTVDETNATKLYFNGTLQSGTTIASTNSANHLTIGSLNSASFFNGTIDEIVVWNRTLTPEQITALYENRTDMITANETSVNDLWQACITPNDGAQDGIIKCSTSILVSDGTPTAPVLDQLLNDTNTTNTTPIFNWTISTNVYNDIINYTVLIFNSSNFDSRDIVQQSPPQTDNSYTATTLAEGTYYWKVQATDNNASTNSSTTNLFRIDLTSPSINLITPTDSSSWNTQGIINFTYNVGDVAITNCSLIINDKINLTDSTINNGTTQIFGPILDNGEYNWSINCTDSANQENASETRQLTVNYSTPSGLLVQLVEEEAYVHTGVKDFVINRSGGTIGYFVLTATYEGVTDNYTAGANGGEFKIEVEKTGPVRAVIKMNGDYISTNGTKLSNFITRLRFYDNSPFMRIYHTLNWTEDDDYIIEGLTFRSANFSIPNATVKIGIDNVSYGPFTNLEATQNQSDIVAGTTNGSDLNGEHLDGWIEIDNGTASVFASLRWPWQQYPTGFDVSGSQFDIDLISQPLNLSKDAVVADAIKREAVDESTRQWTVSIGGENCLSDDDDPYGDLCDVSPRGIAKTYEILLWHTEPGISSVDPVIKNNLTQNPVLAYADPAFSTRAALPIPSSPLNKTAFPIMEDSLEKSFDFFTRSVNLSDDTSDGDYGLLNWGDLQYQFDSYVGNFTEYRYWMNTGKLWSTLPWILWLRSGDRRYWEHGEANSRHRMDVDTSHVDYTDPVTGATKEKGGAYEYAAGHWFAGPSVSSKTLDPEYLIYYYYLTGYERARDVLYEHVAGINEYTDAEITAWVNSAGFNRDLYVTGRGMSSIYWATWDSKAKNWANQSLQKTLNGQDPETGWFPGINLNLYLSKSLETIAQAFPEYNNTIYQALENWETYLGAYNMQTEYFGSNKTRGMERSSLTTVAEIGNETQVLDAGGVALAQAWTVDNGSSAFRNMPSFAATSGGFGPILRDWIAIMAELVERGKTETDLTIEPLTHMNAQLPVNSSGPWAARHVVLVYDENDELFNLYLQFDLTNLGTDLKVVKIKEYLPNSSLFRDRNMTILTSYDQQLGNETLQLNISSDNQTGVYAFEIWNEVKAPVYAISTMGKIIHYVPPGSRNFVSKTNGGQVWFEYNGTDNFSMNYARLGTNNYAIGQYPAIDADGNVLASSKITGWQGSYVFGDILNFNRTSSELFSVVVGNNAFNALNEINNTVPYVATSQAEWFNVTANISAGMQTLLTNLLDSQD